jgi:hypothetical protein
MTNRIDWDVNAVAEGEGTRFTVSRPRTGEMRSYHLTGGEQADYTAFYRQLAEDFGMRHAHAYEGPPASDAPEPNWKPLLTVARHPKILSGYGDPAVLKTDEGYYLVATSNDAPDAFPILRSDDLDHWEPVGFVFPEGETPDWTASGRHVADFWAPEMARVGDEYWLCYTARQKNNALAIGIAKADHPAGPWRDIGKPLITGGILLYPPAPDTGLPNPPMSGGVIDSHRRRRPALSVLESRHERRLAAPAGRAASSAPGADRAHLGEGGGPPHRRLRRRRPALGQHPPADGALLPHAAADRSGARLLAAG